MKKVFILFLIIISCMSLFAKDITAEGYGDSVQEAKAVAVKNLVSKVYGEEINSKEVTKTTFNTSDKKVISETLVSMISGGTLYGIEYSSAREGRSYKVIVTIPDDCREFYKAKMRITERIIDNYFDAMSRVTFNDKMYDVYLTAMLETTKEYEAYTMVLLLMEDVPIVNSNYTFNTIKNLFD